MKASDDLQSDDGIDGPVGERFGAALHEAGAGCGFAVDYPRTIGFSWVDQPWNGRQLTIRRSPYGRRGVHTGYRWIAIRLSTTIRLGRWADPYELDASTFEGAELPVMPDPPGPAGVWADDPELSQSLWRLAEQVTPHGQPAEQPSFCVLQVNHGAVVWHLRASRLDGPLIADALAVLERVAAYAETNDAALSDRVGRAPGVERTRRIQWTIIGVMAIFMVATIAIPLLLVLLH